MEAAMGETGGGNIEEVNAPSTEIGRVHINGEVNGSFEEPMEVCDEVLQKCDSIVATKLASNVLNDKNVEDISDKLLSDNSIDSSEKDSSDILNNSGQETEENSVEVPRSSSIPGDSSELGPKVPEDVKMGSDNIPKSQNLDITQECNDVGNVDVDFSSDKSCNVSEVISLDDHGDSNSSTSKNLEDCTQEAQLSGKLVNGSEEAKDGSEVENTGNDGGIESVTITETAHSSETKVTITPINPEDRESSVDKIDTETPVKTEKSEFKADESNETGQNTDPKGEITPSKVKKPRKSVTPINLTPRRSSRNLNRQQKTYVEKEDDPDIEEITPEDPLAADPLSADPLRDDKENTKTRTSRKNTIVVNDTKRLVEIAAGSKSSKGGKKEPTLVIIDTNSILSGRGPVPLSQGSSSMPSSSSGYSILPAALPAQGMYPSRPPLPVPPPPPPKPQILPTLTDDMYVVEAPSFIVPYVYEKPPQKPLKDFVEKLRKQIQEMNEREEREQREEEEKAAAKKAEQVKAAAEKAEEERSAAQDEQAVKNKEEEETTEESGAEKVSSENDGKVESAEDSEVKEAKEMAEEEKADPKTCDTDTNETIDTKSPSTVSNKDSGGDKDENIEQENDSAKEQGKSNETKLDQGKSECDKKECSKETSETEVTNVSDQKGEIKVSEDRVSSEEKTDGINSETDKLNKPQTYFDNPLGKFFMQIGINLVQEFVQTDLLRSQKRKREREGGKPGTVTQYAINSLLKNLEFSKENNEPFHLELKKCEFCSFKTESSIVMSQHLETPHMRNYVYRCNYCPLEVRSPHDILYHMEAEHNVRARLERAPAFHQCPNCPFEDNQKGKLTRHLMSCSKKYKPERNQEPPPDWEPPAKLPKLPRRGPLGMGAAHYPPIPGKQSPQLPLLPKLVPAPTLAAASGLNRGRGRPPSYPRHMQDMRMPVQRSIAPSQLRQSMMYRPTSSSSQGQQMMLSAAYQIAGNQIYQSASKSSPAAKLLQQPSISITPLPRQTTGNHSNPNKHGSQSGGSKTTFVICEICDGYIKDLEQLRNHMQWIHKVKIHPKMIYNRPPLNCQKCQFRFFTDQGLERHLLGSHGLVTSSMQEAANKGKDGGRCPVCGRVYQWKLLNHVARDHSMTLKPAHLSYKCTVCTATFGMYKQFENHVYSAHSVVAKRVMEPKKGPSLPRPQPTDTLLKPLKINDEITIIPQPARPRPGPASRTGVISAAMQQRGKVYACEKCEATFDGPSGYSQYVGHLKRRHLRRCRVKVCRLDRCPTCKRRHLTERLQNFLARHKEDADIIELSDDEVVIAGQGRNEITITKVSCAPGPKRYKQRIQQNHSIQVIELEDSPAKNRNADSTFKENGEDSLTAVKERLRRRKSLEISQVDSECPSPQSEDPPAKKRRHMDD